MRAYVRAQYADCPGRPLRNRFRCWKVFCLMPPLLPLARHPGWTTFFPVDSWSALLMMTLTFLSWWPRGLEAVGLEVSLGFRASQCFCCLNIPFFFDFEILLTCQLGNGLILIWLWEVSVSAGEIKTSQCQHWPSCFGQWVEWTQGERWWAVGGHSARSYSTTKGCGLKHSAEPFATIPV